MTRIITFALFALIVLGVATDASAQFTRNIRGLPYTDISSGANINARTFTPGSQLVITLPRSFSRFIRAEVVLEDPARRPGFGLTHISLRNRSLSGNTVRATGPSAQELNGLRWMNRPLHVAVFVFETTTTRSYASLGNVTFSTQPVAQPRPVGRTTPGPLVVPRPAGRTTPGPVNVPRPRPRPLTPVPQPRPRANNNNPFNNQPRVNNPFGRINNQPKGPGRVIKYPNRGFTPRTPLRPRYTPPKTPRRPVYTPKTPKRPTHTRTPTQTRRPIKGRPPVTHYRFRTVRWYGQNWQDHSRYTRVRGGGCGLGSRIFVATSTMKLCSRTTIHIQLQDDKNPVLKKRLPISIGRGQATRGGIIFRVPNRHDLRGRKFKVIITVRKNGQPLYFADAGYIKVR